MHLKHLIFKRHNIVAKLQKCCYTNRVTPLSFIKKMTCILLFLVILLILY